MKTWLLLSFVFIIAMSMDISASRAYAMEQTGSPGILFVSYPSTTTQLQDYVTTDKTNYVLGMGESAIALISGHISSAQPFVTITIKTPYGDSESLTCNTSPMGYFSAPYLIDLNSPSGRYVVSVFYNDQQVSTSFYVMRS
jgi:hypothetical protein